MVAVGDPDRLAALAAGPAGAVLKAAAALMIGK